MEAITEVLTRQEQHLLRITVTVSGGENDLDI